MDEPALDELKFLIARALQYMGAEEFGAMREQFPDDRDVRIAVTETTIKAKLI